MRRFLFIAFLSLFSANVFSQIASDKFDKDGSRIIISKQRPASFTIKRAVNFRLIDIVSVNNADSYYIILNIVGNKKREAEYTKGRKLLIKLNDDSIIELSVFKTLEDDDYQGYGAYVRYAVNEDEIERMIKNEVLKLRIENDFDYIDVNIKKNMFSKSLKTLYEAIKEQRKIEKKSGDEGLYEGF